MAASNLFLTGPKRFGKSTLLGRIINKMTRPAGGYFIQRLFIDGQTRAFRMADAACEAYIPDLVVEHLQGYDDIMAYCGDQMQLFPEVFEHKGVALIQKALERKQLILMDELGRIELKAPQFRQMVFTALDSKSRVVGVLKQEQNEFLNAIRERADVNILDLRYITHEDAAVQIEKFLND